MANTLIRIALTALLMQLVLASCDSAETTPLSVPAEQRPLNQKLTQLPYNKWIRIHQPLSQDWRRQSHAGIAYDSSRGTILIFGSDTHGTNWDNSVHEFDPFTETWRTHYAPSQPESYGADTRGRAIVSEDGKQFPWAMHTFDNVVYDPRLDALIVTGVPDHNSLKNKISGVKIHPTWIYSLKNHTWSILDNNDQQPPKSFAAASTYDPNRDVIMVYKWGIWELGPARDTWMKATGKHHHQIHYMMEYDSKHKKAVVFGNSRDTNIVWVYTPGTTAGAEVNGRK